MLDLHSHTTYSDGTLSPRQLVETVASSGVRALAISDHDTISGWDEAIAAGDECGVEIVPAVELSTVHNGRSLHILGFYPDPSKLDAPLSVRREGRKQRAWAIVDRLAELGYPISLPALGEGVSPSRPHIASAMVAAGHVRSSREAFDRFLADDRPAYIHYPKFSARDGIALIRDCGGIPVWAHPFLFRGGAVGEVFPELLEAGLMGLEVAHPNQGKKQRALLQELCDAHGLLATGGTDYHGPAPGKPARYPKANAIAIDGLDRLKAARAAA
ncbi:MAG: PHP domain-containing protein [Geitlerinemataceae cyanobacterium]